MLDSKEMEGCLKVTLWVLIAVGVVAGLALAAGAATAFGWLR